MYSMSQFGGLVIISIDIRQLIFSGYKEANLFRKYGWIIAKTLPKVCLTIHQRKSR